MLQLLVGNMALHWRDRQPASGCLSMMPQAAGGCMAATGVNVFVFNWGHSSSTSSRPGRPASPHHLLRKVPGQEEAAGQVAGDVGGNVL